MSKRTLGTPDIIQLYQDGMSTSIIAEKANVSRRYISMLLKQHDVKLRPRGSWKRKYSLNEHYFKTWSNNMAYILGFITADGNVAKDAQFVSIAQKEKYILEKIREVIGSNQPLYKNKKTGVYNLNLNSKILKNDLIQTHGIEPNKSSTIKFPNVPDQYKSHFIRGFFDGDGYVNYDKYTVTFVGGSRVFMIQLLKELERVELQPQLYEKDRHYRIHIRGRKSIKLFAEWIYQDKELYLSRKFNEFERENKKASEIRDRVHKATREDVSNRKLQFLALYATSRSYKFTCDCLEIKKETPKRWIKQDEIFKYNFNFINKSIIE